MKKYCKDCKHLKCFEFANMVGDYSNVNGKCEVGEIKTFNNWFGTYKYRELPHEKNKNNDCKDFEAKK